MCFSGRMEKVGETHARCTTCKQWVKLDKEPEPKPINNKKTFMETTPIVENETRKEINQVREIVLELLEKDERCRNDDKWLTYQVMRRYTNIYIPFEDFEKIPAFETIKRVRAKIQNKENLFPPTSQLAIERRKKRQEQFRLDMKNDDRRQIGTDRE